MKTNLTVAAILLAALGCSPSATEKQGPVAEVVAEEQTVEVLDGLPEELHGTWEEYADGDIIKRMAIGGCIVHR